MDGSNTALENIRVLLLLAPFPLRLGMRALAPGARVAGTINTVFRKVVASGNADVCLIVLADSFEPFSSCGARPNIRRVSVDQDHTHSGSSRKMAGAVASWKKQLLLRSEKL